MMTIFVALLIALTSSGLLVVCVKPEGKTLQLSFASTCKDSSVQASHTSCNCHHDATDTKDSNKETKSTNKLCNVEHCVCSHVSLKLDNTYISQMIKIPHFNLCQVDLDYFTKLDYVCKSGIKKHGRAPPLIYQNILTHLKTVIQLI